MPSLPCVLGSRSPDCNHYDPNPWQHVLTSFPTVLTRSRTLRSVCYHQPRQSCRLDEHRVLVHGCPALLTNSTEEQLHEQAHIDYNRVAIVCLYPTWKAARSSLFLPRLTSSPDLPPFSSCPLRRCAGLRAGLRHLVHRCPDCLLGQEDRPLSLRQAHCQGAVIRERHLVGPCQQAHDP